MKKWILLLGIASQIVFAQEQVSPGFDGTLPHGDPIWLPPPPVTQTVRPDVYDLMGVVLQQEELTVRIWTSIDLGSGSMDMSSVQITPHKDSTKEKLKFDIVIHKKNQKKGTKEDQPLCAYVDFTNGPGPAPSGRGEAIRVKKDWWVFVSYDNDVCH